MHTHCEYCGETLNPANSYEMENGVHYECDKSTGVMENVLDPFDPLDFEELSNK